jgi:hypothetical protein
MLHAHTMQLMKRICWLLMLSACSTNETGLDVGDGGSSGATKIPVPPRTGGPPLPQAGGKAAAFWTSAGGTAVIAPLPLGLSAGALSGARATAPSGATLTLGHFGDTLE